MRKIKLVVLLIAGLLMYGNSSGEDLKALKSVKVFVLPYISGKADSSKAWLSSSTNYNINGSINSINEWNERGAKLRTETMTYNDNGHIVASKNNDIEVLYFYDANGHLTERRDITQVGSKQQIERKTWSFDGKGRPAEEKFFSANGAVIWWVVYDYDDDKLIRRRGLHQDMSTYWTEEFGYDTKGRKIRVDYQDNNGLMFRQEAWTYNKEGDTIKYEEYDREGAITSRTVRKYEKGRPESTENQDAEGRPFSFKKYDDRGNLIIEMIYDVDGSVMEEKRTEYDRHGRKTRETKIFRREVVSENKFRYDFYEEEEK